MKSRWSVLVAACATAAGMTALAPSWPSVAAAAATDPSVVGSWTGPFSMTNVGQHLMLIPGTSKLLYFEDGASAAVLDPIAGTETPVPLSRDLFCAGHAVLADGRIAVIGGDTEAGGIGTKEAELFDPVTQTWSPVANMNYARWYPTATTLPDGRMLAVSGSSGTLTNLSNTPEIYDPKANTWTPYPSATNNIPYYPFLYVLPDGRIAQVGATEQATSTQILDPATMTWSTLDPTVIDAGSSTMYRPGKILKAGTASDGNTPVRPSSASTYLLDMTAASPAWRQVGSMAYPRAFLNLTTLPDGNVLATGGETTADGINIAHSVYAAEQWSPSSEAWTTLASMTTPRLYHSTAALLPDGRVLVTGSGNDGAVPTELSYEIYSPPYLFKGARPTISSSPSATTYGSSFFVGTPDASRIASAALIRTASVTHSFDENARFVPVSFSQTSGGLNVQAPANANLAPPGSYLLFLVDSNGVPSVAPYISLQPDGSDVQPPSVSLTSPAAGATVSGTVSLTASATDNVGVTGVQFLVDGAAVGPPVTAGPYTMNWDSSTAGNGPHTITATATDAAGNTGTAAPVSITVSNTQPPPPTAISIDAQTSKDGTGTQTTAALSTTGPDLLVALVSADGLSGQTATVSGAGLTWTLAKRANAQPGTSEVWTATAPGPLTAATITATLKTGGYDQSLTVLALKGASGVGASTAAAATSGGPTASLTTTRAGSLVLGNGNDWSNAISRTLGANQSLLHQWLDTRTGDTFWSQTQKNTTPTSGTTVTLNDTAPTGDRWNLTATEILANSSGPVDTQPPSVSLTSPAAGATVSGTVSLTASATDNVGVTGVQFLVDGTAVGPPVTAGPYTMNWDSSTAGNGPHTITATATDAAGNTGTAAPVSITVSNTQPPPPTAISIDAQTSKDGTGTQTTAALSTTGPDLLVALVSADGLSGQTATVSGAGLTWTLAKRANAQPGTSEVWTAPAPGPLTAATITATLKTGGYDQSLTVLALKGASGVGASTAAAATSGGPTASLTTTRAGSLVLGNGNDWSNAISRTLGANQSLLHQWLDTRTGDTFWSQTQKNTTPTSGTTVTLNDTAPTGDRWNLTAIEVLAS